MDTTKVQQVSKPSSDELLRKFADSGDELLSGKKDLRVTMKQRWKRSRRSGEAENCESPSNCSSSLFVERKSLLPPATRKSASLIRLGRSKLRARNFKNKSFLGTIEKTWRRTVEGASKVFIEKHYNRHKRLIDDAL